ncbi:MAG: acyl-CoA thioesterase [Parahaliea sp.]
MANTGTSDPLHHPFNRAIRLTATGADRYQGQITADYANFIGPFGGTLAAVLLQAVCLSPQRMGTPLVLTVNFGGPVDDSPFTVTARATRTNRSSQHWVMDLQQHGETPLTASAIVAERRDSWTNQERAFPGVPAPQDCPQLPTQKLSRWVSNYEMRVVRGIPADFSGSAAEQDSSETVLWVRDQPQRALDFLSLAAMADSFFPRLFIRRPTMVPVGTVSLSTYFHADQVELDALGSDFLLACARAKRFHKGFHDQSAELWSRDGQLLVSTQQMVYFKS